MRYYKFTYRGNEFFYCTFGKIRVMSTTLRKAKNKIQKLIK